MQCWGAATFGRLGNGSTIDRPTPTAVSGSADALEIAAGNRHTCARRASGAVSCWGRPHAPSLAPWSGAAAFAPTSEARMRPKMVRHCAACSSSVCFFTTSGSSEQMARSFLLLVRWQALFPGPRRPRGCSLTEAANSDDAMSGRTLSSASQPPLKMCPTIA